MFFSKAIEINFDAMKNILPQLALLFIMIESYAQSTRNTFEDSLKTFKAIRITNAPKIDGLADDDAWKNSEAASGFIQNFPHEGNKPSQQTEVKIAYDNYAIYVYAMMYDSSPDSILHELGSRDDADLNAEKFRFVIDPYNTRHDAYDFGVYSSGVQIDSRFSDATYNGVWQSAVKIHNNGWSVEMKIPYSAIRFPNTKEQSWGLQLTRDIRRNREFDQWALTPNGKANPQKYWGTLLGISDIKPPLRLSLTPYFSSYYEKAPEYNSDGSYKYVNSLSYNGGADIKYGLDERFTLDMTLLPDFGQVQSDNKVKNLSYREVTYADYRPFFKEGTDLFNKDQLFYSRRIGKTPTNYLNVADSLKPGEKIDNNPSQAKLLNATKISGRTNGGLGIGFFNAITNNTYADIKDSLGNSRKLLTEPFTNYNSVVLDQQLKNASNIYLINTDVARKGKSYRDANVTGTGFSFQNKKNTWEIDGSSDVSQIITKNDTFKNKFSDQIGYYYFMGIRKISGMWQYSLTHDVMSSTYDRSDMGYQSINNYSAFNGYFSHNLFKPWKFLLRSGNNINMNYSYNYVTHEPTNVVINLNLFALTRNNLGVWAGGGSSPVSGYDYYEPRVAGKFFRTSEWFYGYAGFSTNYQKTLAVDVNFNTGNFAKNNIHHFKQEEGYSIEIKPRVRVSDRLSFIYDFNYGFDPFNPGYANIDSAGNVIIGGRRLNTFVNTLTTRYLFKNDLSLALNARHYWSTGHYRQNYTLLDNGLLAENNSYSVNNDFSYNAFNIDAVFSWQFSPGSIFSIVYKNAIETGTTAIPSSYMDNFSYTLQSPQANSISLKVLYYLDYQQVSKRKLFI